MNETDYFQKIEAAFLWLEDAVDRWNTEYDLSIECQRNGPVLEVELESGQKIIVNAQAPTQQLWLASSRGAHHFVWRDSRWEDTRGQGLFEPILLAHASALSGLDLD